MWIISYILLSDVIDGYGTLRETATAYFWWMLWEAPNELAKISGDFGKKILYDEKNENRKLIFPISWAIMPPRSLTLPAGAIP